jgi:hypothetical protein
LQHQFPLWRWAQNPARAASRGVSGGPFVKPPDLLARAAGAIPNHLRGAIDPAWRYLAAGSA